MTVFFLNLEPRSIFLWKWLVRNYLKHGQVKNTSSENLSAFLATVKRYAKSTISFHKKVIFYSINLFYMLLVAGFPKLSFSILFLRHHNIDDIFWWKNWNNLKKVTLSKWVYGSQLFISLLLPMFSLLDCLTTSS